MANNVNQDKFFSITGTKLYVPVVTLLTQYNAKLLEQLKSVNSMQMWHQTFWNWVLNFYTKKLRIDEPQQTSYKR